MRFLTMAVGSMLFIEIASELRQRTLLFDIWDSLDRFRFARKSIFLSLSCFNRVNTYSIVARV